MICRIIITLNRQIPVDASNVAGYVAYEEGAPRRITTVNRNYWNQTSSTGARGNATLSTVEQLTAYHLNPPMGAGATADTIT